MKSWTVWRQTGTSAMTWLPERSISVKNFPKLLNAEWLLFFSLHFHKLRSHWNIHWRWIYTPTHTHATLECINSWQWYCGIYVYFLLLHHVQWWGSWGSNCTNVIEKGKIACWKYVIELNLSFMTCIKWIQSRRVFYSLIYVLKKMNLGTFVVFFFNVLMEFVSFFELWMK